jgi:DNA-binding beta-propeller fold protein YncE
MVNLRGFVPREEGLQMTTARLCIAIALFSSACSDDSTDSSAAATTQLPDSGNAYTLFESLQVRPLALSPNGKLLFAANTPDNRLEIFRIKEGQLQAVGSVSVGLEPVAVAARSNDEIWVVNHLSDSVSIVTLDTALVATVTRTLHVGDEPRDIVFAGPNKTRAFITTAHRGQNTGDAYDLQTQGVGRADVWVFDADNLGTAAGGTRLTKLTLFADTPRALAVSKDGSKVYAAAFMSGNQTTAVSQYAVHQMYPNGMPGPATINLGGLIIPQPPTGLIVKYTNGHWVDAYGTIFDAFVKIKLPDQDVFAINANANPPAAIASGAYPHVGTTLFNMAVNPVSGKVYVTNTDAHNDIRFEGHTAGFTTVRGRIADSRITVIDPTSNTVAARDLNPHVDFTQDGNPTEKAKSVAFPQDLAFSSDGTKLYVVAQGSGKLAIYNTADIDAGTITPSAANQVTLSGGGPTGVALDEVSGRAYVLTRFDNSISVVNTSTKTEVGKVKMFNPEPQHIVDGRKFLYDANLTSQHGTTACASCHIGGDKDELGWDLGNPGGIPLSITKLGQNGILDVFTIDPAVISALLPRFAPIFRFNMPLKGPMTTQSLRGMDNHGAMHWRGDRNGAVQQNGAPFIDPATNAPIVSKQPNAGIFDENKAFISFNVAFPGLIGSSAQLSTYDMQAFTDFILEQSYPPNPIRNLDNSLTAEQEKGRAFYFNHVTLADGTQKELPSDRFFNCNGCHTLDATANMGSTKHPGFFGTDGKLSFEFETQIFKVPHLRNMYTKIGMFGSSPDDIQPGTLILQQAPAADQVRGFGFQHDGSLGTLEHFFTGLVFLKATTNVTLADGTVVPPNPFGIPFVDVNALGQGQIVFLEDGGFALRKAIVAFMMAFDTNEAPIVGQQITLTKSNAASAGPRIDLLEARARAGECDLVAKSSSILGANSGMLYDGTSFQPASMALYPIADASLRGLVAIGLLPAVTFTCVPVGEGQRIAIDRDDDGYADWDEVFNGKSPSDPSSHP